MTKNSKITGDRAEEEAVKFLLACGYIILERNWRHAKNEIDIIAQNHTHIIFVEVKFRKNNEFGTPLEAVSEAQTSRIMDASDHYLNENEIDLMPRFDVISIKKQNHQFDINHHQDVFRP
jgi:putative endonuclease